MRRPGIVVLLTAAAGLCGCGVSFSGQQPAGKWRTAFWFWDGSSADVQYSGRPLDALYVQVGTIERESLGGSGWGAYGRLPRELAPAREYWLVFRYDRQGLPDAGMVPAVAKTISGLRTAASKRHLNIAGVQLDIDSPTGSLADYAKLLAELRKALPRDCRLSITALLDWFRHGTAIGDVIDQVDEFVPQFYDVAGPDGFMGFATGTAIAHPIDAERWGPIFSRFGKRYSVGISTFGRAQTVAKRTPSDYSRRWLRIYPDLRPLDVALNPAFQLQTSRNEAGEVVLSYRALRRVSVGYTRFDEGDSVEFILATPGVVRAAVQSARRMKGSAGVVFFRWPASDESLTMQPDEVMRAAGTAVGQPARRSEVSTVDGRCVAVSCVDLYLETDAPYSPRAMRYVIRASSELEYFLPEKDMPVRMDAPSRLAVSLPPYCARGRLYLGRAVTANAAAFTVVGEP